MDGFVGIFFAAALPILSAAACAQQTAKRSPNSTQAAGGLVLVVSLADRRLAVVDHGAIKRVYRVAVGKPSTPSPTEALRVVSRVSNPTYSHKGRVVISGPGNPVETRWIGLSEKGYGIHGTNAPSSIGKAASHGCIWMPRRDLEELFAMLKTAESVEIIDQPNAETSTLFETEDSARTDGRTKDGGRSPATPQSDSMNTGSLTTIQESPSATARTVAATTPARQ